MIADILYALLEINIALAGAALLVFALRRPMRALFGGQVSFLLWWAVPLALIAVVLPARLIEVTVPTIAMSLTAETVATAATSATWTEADATFDLSTATFAIWLLGAVTMLALLAMRQWSFRRSLGALSRASDGTLRTSRDDVGPIILGVVRPALVLPRHFESQFAPFERELIMAHEHVHLSRRDTQVKAAMVLIQCLCWFNPLAHIAVWALRIDQELACDATVIGRYPRDRRRYAETLLKAQLAPMRSPVGCTWSSGARALKLRVTMLKRDPPTARRLAAGSRWAVLLCIASACSAWAGQPPREVMTTTESKASRQLIQAVVTGDAHRAAVAIDAGANVDARTNGGLTALTVAARADDIRMVELLLERGADVHLTSRREGNALVAAGRRGQLRAVAALVEHGATINEIVPEYGTPLVASVRTGQFAVVKYLVEHGADVNQPSPLPAPWDRWGVMRTALDVAVGGSHTSIANYLRSMGAKM